jgi:hypothetical protein
VSHAGAVRRTGARRPLTLAGGGVAGLVVAVAGLLAGTGWLYVFRGLGWLGVGPRIANSLPLLQLASADAQPLLRVVVAWALAGALAGVALREFSLAWKALPALILGMLILLAAAQASYALTRNLGFSAVVFSRDPGFGPVLEALVFTLGCALPWTRAGGDRGSARRRELVSLVGGLRDRGMRGRQHGHSGEDDEHRHQVQHGQPGART